MADATCPNARFPMFRLSHGRPVRAPPPPPKADPEYAALLSRLGYLPEAHTDVTTRYVLNDLIKANSSAAAPSACATPPSGCASYHKTVHTEPLLLIMTMPWFLVHTGHIRAWTLLHRFRYACLFPQLNMRMLVLVQPGELQGCLRICPPSLSHACECKTAEHDRAFQHRNLAVYATGEASILYAHADTWINLIAARKLADAYGNSTMSPRAGLQGSNYQATPSRCFPQGPELNRTRAWFWHLDGKPECISANSRMGEEILGAAGSRRWQANPSCCYGWVDIAYIPRRAHQAFRKASLEAFWKVQLEVAMPTIFHAMEVRPASSRNSNSSTAAAATTQQYSRNSTQQQQQQRQQHSSTH